MTVWWPVLLDRLVVLIPNLPAAAGFVVHDGPPVSDTDSPRWVSVGWSSRDGESGSFEQPDSTVDTFREESGTVLVEIVSWSGDDNLPTHRADVLAVYAALDAAVRADQRLGVLPVGSTVTLSATPLPARDSNGTTQRLIVSVNYFCRS